VTWGGGVALLLIMAALPWMPPMRRPAVARLDLENCNGCQRCYADCPYNAIDMVSRRDGRPFSLEPVVDSARCVSCGICVGACPTSMPFRRLAPLSPGIDLPDRSMAQLRDEVEGHAGALAGPARIMVFGCDQGVPLDHLRSGNVAVARLACIAQLPPAFIDYVLSRNLADGVCLTGCASNACHNRFGIRWFEERLAGRRDPHLRARVPRERIRMVWSGQLGAAQLVREIKQFEAELVTLGPLEIRARASRPTKVSLDA
jgi:ferredoxin